MDAENHPELHSLEGGVRNIINGVTDTRAQEDGESRKSDEVQLNHTFCVNGMEFSEETMSVKTEPGATDDSDRYGGDDEDRKDSAVKAEGASEDGLDEECDEERLEEEEDLDDEEEEERDREGDEEGESLNEPQDLSLIDYGRHDAFAAAGASSPYAPGAAAARGPGVGGGKLSCDICGLSCVSINVLLVHKRSHTGERPFHCTQCGASFTQKGNLLRHIKLHSGEKPFKCPMCSYACRRRDALSGHLRTHSVEKPYKCNHCGRSYKQRSSLEEHRERCHIYVQDRGQSDREDGPASRPQMGPERALLLDRLASNVARRKSSMPQKFTGDNGVCLDLSFNRGLIQRAEVLEPSMASPGPDTQQQQQQSILGPDHDPAPSHRSYPVQPSRNDVSPLGLTNGHKLGLPPQGHHGLDSFHADGSPFSQPLMFSIGNLLRGSALPNGVPQAHAPPVVPLSPLDALRVMRTDGEAGLLPGAVYPCGHCRVIFLDYVMFTIHMGCHGFRDPLECNVCGHRSRDRYEFSSHIVRGEHRLELK